jgi:multicomponent Na+:H+ antiporter subunit E
MPQLAIAALLLFAFWVLLSGFLTPFLLGAGAACSLAVTWFAHRMEVMDREGHPYHLTLAALTYWPWLLREILKSALDVSYCILHPRLPVSPAVVHFVPRQRTAVGIATHANSITLTPGTLSVEVDYDSFTVHALTTAGGELVKDSEMDRRVERFEGSG